MEAWTVSLWFFSLYLIISGANADPVQDKRALLEFLTITRPARTLNWNETTPLCQNWTGVTCNHDESRIIAVRLPAIGLNGQIPPNTISRLSALRVLSLRSNRLSGPFPLGFSRAQRLSLSLPRGQRFLRPVASGLLRLEEARRFESSNNRFNGTVPLSLSGLKRLQSLNLANNSLSGVVPDDLSVLSSLKEIDLSNNNLHGPLPGWLLRFPPSSYQGIVVTSLTFNRLLNQLERSLKDHKDGLPPHRYLCFNRTTRGFSVCVCSLLLEEQVRVVKDHHKLQKKGGMSPEKFDSRMEEANNRLSFFEGCSYSFDLEDLLRASAEILGKGTFGTTYKAVLEDATSVAVKRLKDVAAGNAISSSRWRSSEGLSTRTCGA
ncbi:putative inactive receptor kinase [Raphanus sativus]|nr:putative inactive receptor kinase [Raphanus sativus]